MEILLFISAMALGGGASWQLFSWYHSKKSREASKDTKVESFVLLERIEKVFKVILAEGYFTEIYDHATKKHFFGIFRTHSKALVVVKAKVAMGYDFTKMQFRSDPLTRTLIIEHFAKPEIISVETDYRFYDINQGMLNKFDNHDYTSILAEAKKLMQEKAYQSDLPAIAQRQIQLVMQELCSVLGWQLILDKKSETIIDSLVKLD